MPTRIWIMVAALSGALGVALGAFQAHGLAKYLERQGVQEDLSRRVENCETAVRYQMFHAPVLLAIGILPSASRSRCAHVAAALFLAGTILFSGGLYLSVFTGSMGHWAIVPSGGLCLILGWIAIGFMALTPPAHEVST